MEGKRAREGGRASPGPPGSQRPARRRGPTEHLPVLCLRCSPFPASGGARPLPLPGSERVRRPRDLPSHASSRLVPVPPPRAGGARGSVPGGVRRPLAAGAAPPHPPGSGGSRVGSRAGAALRRCPAAVPCGGAQAGPPPGGLPSGLVCAPRRAAHGQGSPGQDGAPLCVGFRQPAVCKGELRAARSGERPTASRARSPWKDVVRLSVTARCTQADPRPVPSSGLRFSRSWEGSQQQVGTNKTTEQGLLWKRKEFPQNCPKTDL